MQLTYKGEGLKYRQGAHFLKQGEARFSYRHSCEEVTKASYRDDWCHPGNTDGAPEVLLLGDSFANAYAPTLARLAEKHPLTFKQFGRGQCTLLFGYGPKPCRDLLDAVVASVDRSKSHTIILALDWRAYVNGKEYFAMRVAAPSESPQAFREAL